MMSAGVTCCFLFNVCTPFIAVFCISQSLLNNVQCCVDNIHLNLSSVFNGNAFNVLFLMWYFLLVADKEFLYYTQVHIIHVVTQIWHMWAHQGLE